MTRLRHIPAATLLCLSLLFIYSLWQQDSPNTVFASLGTIRSLPSTDPSELMPSGFKKIALDFQHLGYQKTVYTKPGYRGASANSVLLAATLANENAFGGGRTYRRFYNALVENLEYPKDSTTLAWYCGSAALLEVVIHFFDNVLECPFNQVTILYAPFLQNDFKKSEHKPSLQRIRRRNIAQGRNFVLSNALEGEQYTLFVDADIIGFEQPDILTHFIASGKDIIAPRTRRASFPDYDWNSWKGERIQPSPEQLDLMDQDKWDEANFVPLHVLETFHLGDHFRKVENLPETDPQRALGFSVPLDSVGGAVLFAKSIVYKLGVLFPTMNMVGTAWSRKEGYDGIETEGLCYAAQNLGFECAGMPNLVAKHSHL